MVSKGGEGDWRTRDSSNYYHYRNKSRIVGSRLEGERLKFRAKIAGEWEDVKGLHISAV